MQDELHLPNNPNISVALFVFQGLYKLGKGVKPCYTIYNGSGPTLSARSFSTPRLLAITPGNAEISTKCVFNCSQIGKGSPACFINGIIISEVNGGFPKERRRQRQVVNRFGRLGSARLVTA